jgi:hypothetical protein
VILPAKLDPLTVNVFSADGIAEPVNTKNELNEVGVMVIVGGVTEPLQLTPCSVAPVEVKAIFSEL